MLGKQAICHLSDIPRPIDTILYTYINTEWGKGENFNTKKMKLLNSRDFYFDISLLWFGFFKIHMCSKMAQQGKVLVAKPNDLNLTLRIHMAKGKNFQAVVVCVQAVPGGK